MLFYLLSWYVKIIDWTEIYSRKVIRSREVLVIIYQIGINHNPLANKHLIHKHLFFYFKDIV